MRHLIANFRVAGLRTRGTIAAFWVLLLVGFSVYASSPVTFLSSPFNVGDWIINYQAGFVRRGFIGEILYQLAKLTNSNIGFLAVYFQIILLVFIGFVVTYLSVRNSSKWLAWIVLSPVGFLYATYNGDGGYRKELLLFTALAMLALATRTSRRNSLLLLWLSLLTFGVTVLSWEPAALVLPGIWWLCDAVTAQGVSTTAFRRAFVFVGVLGLSLSSLFHGNAAQMQHICHSVLALGGSNQSVCHGALLELSVTPSQQLATLASFFPKYLWYAGFLGLALLPFALSGWFKQNRRIATSLLFATSMLYFVGTDYGRWIHLQATCLAILWLVKPEGAPLVSIPLRVERSALVAWVIGWSAPYSYNPLIWQGLLIASYHRLAH